MVRVYREKSASANNNNSTRYTKCTEVEKGREREADKKCIVRALKKIKTTTTKVGNSGNINRQQFMHNETPTTTTGQKFHATTE